MTEDILDVEKSLAALEKRIKELSQSLKKISKKDKMEGGTNNIVSRPVDMDTKYVNNRRGPFFNNLI